MASKSPSNSVLTGRRAFLAAAGACGAAAAGALPLRAARSADPVESWRAEGRIGLLLPPAAVAAGLDTALEAGLGAAFEQARRGGADLRIEQVKATAPLAPTALRRAAERLLAEARVDLLVMVAQPGVAAVVAPVFAEAGRCLVAVDGGGCLVRPADQNPHLFHNSLGHWEACWALGRWAARHLPGQGYLLSSGFEAGLDGLRSFRHGLDGAAVGERGFHMPRTPLRDAPAGLDAVASVEVARQAAPGYVAAFLAGREGLEFLRSFQAAGLAGRLPLLGPPVLAEAALAAGRADLLDGFVTAGTWTPGLATPDQRTLEGLVGGRQAGGFAALGFDTGRLLLAAARDGGGHLRFLREALERAQWQGLAGPRRIDPGSHAALGDVLFTRFEAGRPHPFHREAGLAAGAAEADALLRAPHPPVINPYPFQ